MSSRVCTCAGTAPGYPQHESYCGQPENDEDNAPELSPVAGDPELLADGSIVGWEIASWVRINLVGDTILITGNGLHEPPTERTFTTEQLRRFCLYGLAFAERMQA